jgi:hypothetical protein
LGGGGWVLFSPPPPPPPPPPPQAPTPNGQGTSPLVRASVGGRRRRERSRGMKRRRFTSWPEDHPSAAGRLSADLLRQLDDDAFWTPDVAEPVAVLVALQLADRRRRRRCFRRRMGHGECPVCSPGRSGCRSGLPACGISSARVVRSRRGLYNRDLCLDTLEPHDAVHPAALDRPLALQPQSELDEERRRGREILNDSASFSKVGGESVRLPPGCLL